MQNSNVLPIFNRKNTEWKEGVGSLILGQPTAFVDSLNVHHPELFRIYKRQKAADWQEDEVDLARSLLDFSSCPTDLADLMIENITFQWETDSIAANSVLALLSPVITNSQFSQVMTKINEIEQLHALTYSEIVRLAIPNPKTVFEKAFSNNHIKNRNDVITDQLARFKWYSYNYALGNIENNQELYNETFSALVAIFCLERLQFMSSFAYTFMVVDEGWFQGIGKLVQKIMQDEYYYHSGAMKYVITKELYTDRGMTCWTKNREKLQHLVDAVLEREYHWNNHIDYRKSEVNKWAEFNSQDIYKTLMLDMPFNEHDTNPLPMMDKWLNLDLHQNANMEGDSNNYSLNSFVMDVSEDKIYTYY